MRRVAKTTFSTEAEKTSIFNSIGHPFGTRNDAQKAKVGDLGVQRSIFFSFFCIAFVYQFFDQFWDPPREYFSIPGGKWCTL